MSDAVKSEYQERLGEAFGAVFYGVWTHWLDGLVRLKEYRVLFTDRDAVDLLNRLSGGGFMWDVQQVLWRDLLLHLTRLTDPVATGRDRRPNLIVRALPAFCESSDLRVELDAAVQTAVAAAEFARDWRNRRISHSDLRLAIDPDADSLAPATLAQVQAALDAVYVVVATIAASLLDQHIVNDVTITPRAQAFLVYARQLATAVQYIDSIADPGGNAPVVDIPLAERFLRRLGRPLSMAEVSQVLDLREAARRFR